MPQTMTKASKPLRNISRSCRQTDKKSSKPSPKPYRNICPKAFSK